MPADRQIWGTIVDLLQRKWSMDEAFHELTHGRMEIHSLLMLRPKTSRQPLAAQPAKRPPNPARSVKRPAPRPHKAEPPRKKGKGKTRDNWAATHQGQPICRRFQQGLCKTDNCQFAHVCAIKGCQQAHGASQSGGRSGRSSGQCNPTAGNTRRCLSGPHHEPACNACFIARERGAPSAPTHHPAAEHRTGNSDCPSSIARTAGERMPPHIKGGFLLDVFAGTHAPISAAADRQGASRFEAFDLEANSEHDLLDDACLELLMRISWSGIVSLITLAPPCKEYSRLKLRPGGRGPYALQPACTACLAYLPKKHRV